MRARVREGRKRLGLVALHLGAYGGVAALAGVLDPWMGAFAALLIWVSVVDIERFEVPDLAVVGLVGIGLARLALVAPRDLWWEHLAGGLVWPALFGLVAGLYRRQRGQHGLGLGDVKLMAGIGLWCGFGATVDVVLAAALAGMAVMLVVTVLRRQSISDLGQSAIAFGPFLCLSAWAVFVTGVSG